MGDFDTTRFCDCGHSLGDHAIHDIPPWRGAGECFVGGCGCLRFTDPDLLGNGKPATPKGAVS